MHQDWGNGERPPFILNLYNKAKWVVNFTIQLLHLRGNGTRYPLDGRLDGFKKRFESCGSGRPARSQTSLLTRVLPALRQWGSCWGYVICSGLVSSNRCSDSQPLTTRRSVPVGIHSLPAAQPSAYHVDIRVIWCTWGFHRSHYQQYNVWYMILFSLV